MPCNGNSQIKSWMIYTGYFILAILPLITRNFYHMRLGGSVALYLILALGLNIVAGEAGLLDLGYAAFYGIGAYTYALLASPHFNMHLPFIPVAICGIGLSALTALLISIPTLHLKGDYLAMVTLGFGQIIRILLNNLDRPLNITNGPNGIVAIDAPRLFGISLDTLEMSYIFLWIVTLIVIVIVNRVLHSSIGRAWSAIREDHIAASCMGVNVSKYRVLAFIWGAGLAGLAGVLFASWQQAIFPQNFTMQETITVYCMVVLGGLRSLPGIILGVLLLIIIPELLRAYSIYRMLIYGVALVFLAIYRPQGLIPQGANVSALFSGKVRKNIKENTNENHALHKPSEQKNIEQIVNIEKIVKVRNVTCSFNGLTALSKVSFSVKPGEVVGIIGPNGAGKTTLFNILTGVVNSTSGQAMILNNDITHMEPHEIAELGVARTFQNIRLFENQNVVENVLAGCHLQSKKDVFGAIFRTKTYQRHYASQFKHALNSLEFFGDKLASRKFSLARNLSYPDRRRVELARGLALNPKVILMDEPTAGMTPSEAEEIAKGICILKECGYTILVIEHRMDVIADACDRVIVLDHGKKIAEGTPQEIVKDPKVIQAYLGTERNRSKSDKQSDTPIETSFLYNKHIELHVKEKDMPSEHLNEPILQLKDVHSSYGHIKVLQGINAKIEEGELIVFLGSNASGKTTMLKTILGQIFLDSGEVKFLGKKINNMLTSDIVGMGIGIVPEGRRIFPKLTVLENLELGAYLIKDKKFVHKNIDEALELFPRLLERRNQLAGTLSGGEQQMLAISRALIASPKLILMDEPSMGLAPVLVDKVMEIISDINRKGVTVLLVEQNAQAALTIADRVYILRSGRIIAKGKASDFQENNEVADAYLV